MGKSKKIPPTLDEAYSKLNETEKTTELATGITVSNVYGLIQKNDRKKISKFVYDRFYRRYLMPFEKVNPSYNSGFAQMAVCCLMIEAMESFRFGWNDTMEDAKKPDGARIIGGEIFEGFFTKYEEFKGFRGYGKEFYKSIRCSILHQAEAQNGWRIVRDEKCPLLDEKKRMIHSTRFRYRMKQCLRKYCKELEEDDGVWDFFKLKMAYIIKNCQKRRMKS